MKIVADSSPLIAFAILDRLDLFPLIFSEIHIPIAVYDEVTIPGMPYSKMLRAFTEAKTKTVSNRVAVNLLTNEVDIGEAETIVLALEHGIEDVLMDDAKGRKIAQTNGLHTIGTIGVLLQAKKLGHIVEVKSYFDKLISHRIRIASSLYVKALELTGEEE